LFEQIINIGRLKNIEAVICPPFPFLSIFGSPKSIKLGGQDIFWETQGPYTGQVSGKMLKDLGCDYVILGHSERR
jgi:triosephosphate isomerase